MDDYMVNARNKGNLTERKAVEELKKQGFKWIYRVKGSTRFNKEVDIFSLFDIMTIQKEEVNTPMKVMGIGFTPEKMPKLFRIKRRWIQVKTNKKLYGKELEPFQEFKQNCCDANDFVEIWNWIDRKGFEIQII